MPMDAISSTFSRLKPFSSSNAIDGDDIGEVIDYQTLAGGGHAGRETRITQQLLISPAIRSLLVEKNIMTREVCEPDHEDHYTPALRSIIDRPHAVVPGSLTDRSHRLPDYFISSSHNTYLLAHQLYGSSSAEAYRTTLRAGSRCVEIDAWDGDDKDEPKVTHGYTLTSNIQFRAVCETIRDIVDEEAAQAINARNYRAAPILLSLENHCGEQGQQAMVNIMHEVFGERLLSKAIRDKATQEQQGTGEHVTLAELGSKIAVIVEYHFTGEPESDEEGHAEHDDEKRRHAHKEYQQRKKQAPASVIIPALAELGIYAQSVKPPNNAWFEKGVLENSPHHPLINVSETGLLSHMPAHSAQIARHNSEHLMRVYPKGTRISSANLNPVPFWGIGAHICALNWQTFGASMQLNEALFSGTDGYVLKPHYLRSGGSSEFDHSKRKKRLHLNVIGASDIPIPANRPQNGDDIKPYLTCTLVHPSHTALSHDPPKRKTAPYKQHKITKALHHGPNPPNTDPIWDEVLEWDYEDDELVFLRMLIKSDDAFAANPNLVVGAVRMLYVQRDQWVFIRMLNMKGQETKCSILVKFEVVDL